jgi:hypothetical protein
MGSPLKRTVLLLAFALPGVAFAQTPLGMNELGRAKAMLDLYRAQLSAEQFALLTSRLAQTEQAYVELTALTEVSARAAATEAAAATGGRALLGSVAEVLPLLLFVWPATAHAPGMKEEKPEVRAARAKLAKSVEELNAATRRVIDEQAAAAKRPARKPVVLGDETTCNLRGVQDSGRPFTCTYQCEGVVDTIEIRLPDLVEECPGEGRPSVKWKHIKGFVQTLR